MMISQYKNPLLTNQYKSFDAQVEGFGDRISALFHLHPRKLTWMELTNVPLGKGNTSRDLQFLGSMSIFGGVLYLEIGFLLG